MHKTWFSVDQIWQDKLRYWSIWTLLGIYLSIARTTEQSYQDITPWWVIWYTEMSAAYLGGVTFPLAKRFYEASSYLGWPTAAHWARHILVTPLVTLIAVVLMDAVRYPFYSQLPTEYGLHHYPYFTNDFSNRMLLEWPRVSVIYFSMVFAIFYRKQQLKREQATHHALQVESELNALKLLQLKSQLQPHFLFNSLNMISDKITTAPQVAEALLQQLSELLRYYLVQSDTPWVALEHELAMLHRYLAILQKRFPEQIHFQETIDQALLSQKVPAMLLQPLLENAVMHTIHRYRGNVAIELLVHRQGNWLVIQVCNTLAAADSNKGQLGIGLKNIQKQLELLYKDTAELKLEIDDEQACVEILLPYQKPQAALL